MLSVNQINAQIKLTEIWKAFNDVDHPFKIKKNPVNVEERVTRAMTEGLLKSDALSKVAKTTFINDSITAWNKSPMDIKKLYQSAWSKNCHQKFCETATCVIQKRWSQDSYI